MFFSSIPMICGFNLPLGNYNTFMEKGFDIQKGSQLDGNVSFDDYTDDVICYNYSDVLKQSLFRTDEKPNINLISGGYVQQGKDIAVRLSVEGIIENRGNLSFDENLSYFDAIIYFFRIGSSERNYSIEYCNNSCLLSYNNYSEHINFEIYESTLSVTFSMKNDSEIINYFVVEVFDLYLEYSSFKYIIIVDAATNINYSMDVRITKPVKKLYLFNREVMPFFSPVILGRINVEYEELLNETLPHFIELYVNNELLPNQNFWIGGLKWNTPSFGKNTLKILVFDAYGNRASDEIEVWKFF